MDFVKAHIKEPWRLHSTLKKYYHNRKALTKLVCELSAIVSRSTEFDATGLACQISEDRLHLITAALECINAILLTHFAPELLCHSKSRLALKHVHHIIQRLRPPAHLQNDSSFYTSLQGATLWTSNSRLLLNRSTLVCGSAKQISTERKRIPSEAVLRSSHSLPFSLSRPLTDGRLHDVSHETHA
ncbi:unnamed protein product [Dicrocoelium dendriticum]|nr:unnamed protein product [Dicrocoelium dendriticum]CAH8584213.1 unnamed protein product [Dicrocoelium dendriticum]